MTPTESAAVAARHAWLVSVLRYRSVTPLGLYRSLPGSGRQRVVMPILIATAKALGINLVHFGLAVTVNLMIG